MPKGHPTNISHKNTRGIRDHGVGVRAPVATLTGLVSPSRVRPGGAQCAGCLPGCYRDRPGDASGAGGGAIMCRVSSLLA